MSATEVIQETMKTGGRAAARFLNSQTAEKARTFLQGRPQQLQTKTGQKMERLAHRIRVMCKHADHLDDAQAVARHLEETADYLRFRPTEKVAGDAVDFLRRHPSVPIAGAAAGGLLTWWVISRFRK